MIALANRLCVAELFACAVSHKAGNQRRIAIFGIKGRLPGGSVGSRMICNWGRGYRVMKNRSHRSAGNLVSSGRAGSVEKCFQTRERFGEKSSCGTWRLFPLFVVGLAALVGMSGCALTGNTKASTTTPIITVAMTQTPPTYLNVKNAVPLSATVSDDPADAGVDWVALCGSAPLCGSFSPAHTASGGTTMFTAPSEVPTHSTVTVTVLSTTNHGVQSAAFVTITSGVKSVSITNAPPAALPAGVTINLAATVAGDPSNLGVDWKATCGTSGVLRTPVDCTPPDLHSQPGASIQFAVPSPQQIANIIGSTVILTAYATADHNFSATASFTVTPGPTISLTQVPPSTMLTNATANVAAVVANDTTNSGVTWNLGCTTAPCGSISASTSASGQTVTYTAPATVSGSNVVVISAFPTAVGNSVIAKASVTIVAPVSVKITQGVPTSSIVQGTTAPLIATVSNDPASGGVDWTVSCGSAGACGSFSPAHTASGVATTFTAPSAVPSANNVTITATSTTDPSKSDKQIVTVTAGAPPDSLLRGQFVILLTSKNSRNGPYALGGVITGDGVGNILSGAVDLVDASGNASPAVSLSPSTYSIGLDGRGQIQLLISPNSPIVNFGVNGSGAITLSVVFVTPQHALLRETDSFGSATGTLDLQNATDFASFEKGSWHNGIYSLELSGTEASSPYLGYSVASAVTLDFSTSSYSYIADQSDKGKITSIPFTVARRSFATQRDQNGQLTFINPINLGLPTQFNLDAWLIDANHFVVTDWRDSFSGTPNIIVGGYLTAQPSSPSISGTYAFTEAGATSSTLPQVAGGILPCGSTGTLEVTPLNGTALSNQPITGTCTAPANGRGIIAISGASTAGINQFAAYPTLDQGLYLIELDGGAAGSSGPSGAGVALQQTLSTPISNSALVGNYASSFHADTPLGPQDFSARIVSDGISTLSGVADVGFFNTTAVPPIGTPSLNATLAGSFTAGADGRFPMTLTIVPATGQPTPEFTTLHSACYFVDANMCLLLGLDITAPGTGLLRLQNTGL